LTPFYRPTAKGLARQSRQAGNASEQQARERGEGVIMQRNAIAVASWGSNRLDIFGLGTDNQMFHKAWDGNAWRPSPTGWEPLGGKFDSPPAVASWGSNRLDIFGLGTDNQMFHKAWDGNAWRPSPTDWEPLGGVFNVP
jgi:hypothetical protein